MRVTVCELNDDHTLFERDWNALVEHVHAEQSQMVLLPEMAFAPWFGWRRPFEADVWDEAVAAHDAWLARLIDLAPAVVLGTRPTSLGGRRENEAFVSTPGGEVRLVHAKYYLPDEPGFWEASWYERGDGDFTPAAVDGVSVGFQICTELWFFERSRAYGRQGVHLIANPRATEKGSVDKWLAGGRAAAVVSGAFCLSSNKVNTEGRQVSLGGQGWIVDPDGTVLGVTSRARPFLTLDVDLAQAERAKQTYPRYVGE